MQRVANLTRTSDKKPRTPLRAYDPGIRGGVVSAGPKPRLLAKLGREGPSVLPVALCSFTVSLKFGYVNVLPLLSLLSLTLSFFLSLSLSLSWGGGGVVEV